MQYNKKYGKIESENAIKFAPSELDEYELLSNGWLPILPSELEFKNDNEYVYIAAGWEEHDGHIQKKFQKRKRLEYMRKYSKEQIINRLGETYQPFVQNLSQNNPKLLSAFNQNTIYFESCNELHQCMDIYREMYGLTIEQIEEQILVPSIIQ